jgi:hypothetical protein
MYASRTELRKQSEELLMVTLLKSEVVALQLAMAAVVPVIVELLVAVPQTVHYRKRGSLDKKKKIAQASTTANAYERTKSMRT